MLHPRTSKPIDWTCWSAMHHWGFPGNCALLCLWSLFQSTSAIESYISMVLIGFVVYTSDTCTADFDKSGVIENTKPVQCYDCSTYDNQHFCADPFNITHPDVKTTLCYEPCAKWVRIPRPGVKHYIRKCSSDISMQMPISLVCMEESRPGDGHLCFCRRSQCNHAPPLHKTSKSPLLVLSFLTLLLIERYFTGHTCAGVTRWLVYICTIGFMPLYYLVIWLFQLFKMVAAYPAYNVINSDHLSQLKSPKG